MLGTVFNRGDRAQQRGNRQLALAIDFSEKYVSVAGFEFDPCTAVRDQLDAA